MTNDKATHLAEERLFKALASGDGELLDSIVTDDCLLIDVMTGSEVPRTDFVNLVGSRQLVFDSIERLGLAKNTYVIYMADNGASGGKKALRGGKGGVWEGGIRVPLIIRGPGVEANSWCHVPVVGFDFFPTFCEWAGVPKSKLPPRIEGGSIAGLLTHGGKGEVDRERTGIVFHFPHYQGEDGPQSAIIDGHLKLVKLYEDERIELYDLSEDIAERNNLAGQMPDQVKRLTKELDQSLAQNKAQFPTPNPDYDPNKPAELKKRGGKNKSNSGSNSKKNGGTP